MSNEPKVSVIIVNYNAGSLLTCSIEALLAQDMSDFEIILVDNGSQDGSLDTLSRFEDPRLRIVRLGWNSGFAAGVNCGAALARARWLATLNPDAFPAIDWLSRFLKEAARYSEVVFFGSLQISAEDDNYLDGCGDSYHVTGIPWRGGYGAPISACPGAGEVFGPCAAAAFYRADVFREIGGFDESFFCYCEDVDLAFRLRLLGYRCLQLTSVRVRHVGSAVTGRTSPFVLFHSVRNRMWVVVKNMPLPLLTILLPLHMAATLYLIFRCRRTLAFAPQWMGFKAGVIGLPKAWAQRRRIQASRRVSSWKVARAFTWSLRKLRRLEADVRPWKSVT